MKKTILLSLFTLITSMAINATEGNDTPPPCINGPSTITLGQTYQYTSSVTAQCSNCYDWDISGVANISSNDTENTVTINPTSTGTFTLNLTYFRETGCTSCTRTITVLPDDCDDCVRINITTNPSGDCLSAEAYLNDCLDPSIVSVEWSWDLSGQCSPAPCSLGTVTSNDHPLFNSPTVDLSQVNLPPHPVGYFIIFSAKINYSDNTFCEDSYSKLLTCWNTNDNKTADKTETLHLFPNPAANGSRLFFDGIEASEINTIEVFDTSGVLRMNITPNDKSVLLKNLTRGIYIVDFNLKSNEKIQKTLLIE